MGKRFNVVPMYNIKSHFVTIDSGVFCSIMSEISPEFDVSRKEFSGGNRETYWMSIFDFKRPKVSKKKVFTGSIETDGVALCVHYRRLKTDRPAPPVTKDGEKEEAGPATQEVEDNVLVVDAAKDEDQKEAGLAMQEVHEKDLVVDVTKYEDEKEAEPAMQNVEDNDLIVDAAEHEENKEEDSATQEVEDNDLVVNAEKHEETKKAGPVTQKVQGNDFVVGADPGNTNIIAVAVPKRAEDGADGNLRQKDMRLLRFSRARYYRDPV